MIIETVVTTKQFNSEVNSVFSAFQQTSVQKVLCSYEPIESCSKARSVAISCIGSARMKSLNQQYRQKTASTDVLSFEIHDGSVWGELYVCPDDINKNARMMGHTFERELIEIIIHGLLHLTGIDHGDEMFKWQKQLTNDILKLYEDHSWAR
jgi:rRNA maturation RNase YbeY